MISSGRLRLAVWPVLPWEGRRAPISIVPHVTHTAGTRLRDGNAFFSNSSPGVNSRVENKKAGQNFYRSDLLKLLVAGTGFEPMTFGLQEQRRPPCFFLFSAFLGIPGLSLTRIIRYSLPIFSPIPCWRSSPPMPAYKTGWGQLRKTRATRTARHHRKFL